MKMKTTQLSKQIFKTSLLLLFLALTFGIMLTRACMPQGVVNANGVARLQPTYVCLVVNDRNVTMTIPKADEFSRIVITGSFNATLSRNNQPACFYSDKDPISNFWFPLGCPLTPQLPRRSIGSYPYLVGVGQTVVPQSSVSLYVQSMGVSSLYKKTYFTFQSKSNNVYYYFPILTAVIQVDSGTVTSVYWDDGCYFCPRNDGSLQEQMNLQQQNCIPNAYNITSNQQLKFNGTSNKLGYDCALTASAACTRNTNSLCDLGIYVVWVGTDSAGHQMTSAGRRFQRYRDFGMEPELQAMKRFGGNDLNQFNTDTALQNSINGVISSNTAPSAPPPTVSV